MISRRWCWTTLAAAGLFGTASPPIVAYAQVATGTTFDETVAPGSNYDTAKFRLWYPPGASSVQGIVVLVPGSNDDGRSEADDSVWQTFAVRHRLALVGCYFTDKPHPQDFIEEYADVSKGSGQALLTALTAFAEHARHPELARVPLLLWGMSAGGEFDYEFVAWKPERVIAFVVNKGGIYYTALMPRAARVVPGLLFVGEKDLEVRTKTITGLFAVNRRAGALWALTEEPGAGHIVGRSRDLALIFFDDVLARRLDASSPLTTSPGVLKSIAEQSGFLGDLRAKTLQAAGDGTMPDDHPLTAWLPTERAARAWQAVVTGVPFDPHGR